MKTKKQIRYIWDYYKLHIIAAIILLYFLSSIAFRILTHRDTLLYAATVNVVSSDEISSYLHDDFISSEGIEKINPKKQDVTLYHDLYLTTDTNSEFYDYSYASEMKLVGAIGAKQLDVVIMDKEAFDAFSANDYLLELDSFLENSDKECGSIGRQFRGSKP